MPEAGRSIPKQPASCVGTRRDGLGCAAPVRSASGYCFAHDPTMTQERALARQKGGLGRSHAARLQALLPPRLVPIFDRLETALAEVHAGSLDPRVATAMSSLAGAMTKVLSAGEMEERLRELEARVDA